MSDDYLWITKNGYRIRIKNKQSPMDAFIRQTSKMTFEDFKDMRK